MLISWRKRFLLLHWPKTGGTSLTRALLPYARPRDRLAYSPARARLTGLFDQRPDEAWIERLSGFPAHVFLRNIEAALGREALAPLRRIAFCRNPYSWAWSYYQHVRRLPQHALHGASETETFDAFVRWLSRRGQPRQMQQALWRDGSGPDLDFIGRFETFEEDAARLAALLDAPALLRVGKLNAADGPPPDYVEAFRTEGARFVDHFAADFDYFGYSTDPADALAPPASPTGRAPGAATKGDAPQ